MLEFLNVLASILSAFVNLLFSLSIVPGVSVGTLLLYATIAIIVVKAFWVRSD